MVNWEQYVINILFQPNSMGLCQHWREETEGLLQYLLEGGRVILSNTHISLFQKELQEAQDMRMKQIASVKHDDITSSAEVMKDIIITKELFHTQNKFLLHVTLRAWPKRLLIGIAPTRASPGWSPPLLLWLFSFISFISLFLFQPFLPAFLWCRLSKPCIYFCLCFYFIFWKY